MFIQSWTWPMMPHTVWNKSTVNSSWSTSWFFLTIYNVLIITTCFQINRLLWVATFHGLMLLIQELLVEGSMPSFYKYRPISISIISTELCTSFFFWLCRFPYFLKVISKKSRLDYRFYIAYLSNERIDSLEKYN